MRKSVRSLVVVTALVVLQGAVAIIEAQNAQEAPRTAVIGCLQRAGGRYTLKDVRGGTYTVVGEAQALDVHIGHHVELQGRFQGASDNAPFKAEAVIYIAEKCQ